MKINKLTIIIGIIFLIFLSSCQSVKEGLAGKRQKSGDEFLVQKKNPLVKPENFDELPKPSQKKNVGNTKIDDQDNIEDLFQIESDTIETTSTSTTALEKSILKKINEN